ncbi:YbjN domain-containing protein, partial [Mycobacterium tuberculosis]
RAAVSRFLLRRPRRLSGVASPLAPVGALSLVGQLALSAVAAAAVARVLGQVFAVVASAFHALLALGFRSSLPR